MDIDIVKTLPAEKANLIFQVKAMVGDLYQKKDFHSFSLITLELSRRFTSRYNKYLEERSPEALKELCLLAEKLEKRISSEDPEIGFLT